MSILPGEQKHLNLPWFPPGKLCMCLQRSNATGKLCICLQRWKATTIASGMATGSEVGHLVAETLTLTRTQPHTHRANTNTHTHIHTHKQTRTHTHTPEHKHIRRHPSHTPKHIRHYSCKAYAHTNTQTHKRPTFIQHLFMFSTCETMQTTCTHRDTHKFIHTRTHTHSQASNIHPTFVHVFNVRNHANNMHT
jgi:hypothetical protein